MPAYFEYWPLFVFLAMLVGFAAERASICTVKAVEELMTSRRAFYFLSFAKTVLWAAGISILLIWWFGIVPRSLFSGRLLRCDLCSSWKTRTVQIRFQKPY